MPKTHEKQHFPLEFIAKNPGIFLNHDWIQISDLKKYIASLGNSRDSPFTLRSSSPIPELPLPLHRDSITSKRVKRESSVFPVKSEDIFIDLTASDSPKPIKMHTAGQRKDEIIEILYSDDEDDGGVEMREDVDLDFEQRNADDGSDTRDDGKAPAAPTDWLNSQIQSKVVHDGHTIAVTRQLKVERVEILTELPSAWPVSRSPTAWIVDLRHSKLEVRSDSGALFSVDHLIRNKVSLF